ncbi:hypothetical protein [Pseudomonas sp. MH10]|uniref:hypothetical protein n=1 Tax=Pseudomonas sp. MH10 TaxID=3048627 RepID=UPI002AC9E9AE|nr:hypothetical protein [Pseudomonas sp. MH10]MEB0042651.1 hypothetical protein [Pseudomonas sp. MH10]WPX63525.1 hypothetical protein RHM59_22010 [Pseudomonas sp. MH10]
MSFSLSYDELQSVNLAFDASQIFPPEVLETLKFQFPRLNSWQPLKPADFLSLAYFGANVVPGSYGGFKGIVEKAYKDAIARGELKKLPRNEIYRLAAEEYGFSSLEAFQNLYLGLDKVAAGLNAPSYAKICDTAAYIELQLRSELGKVSFPKGTRQTYVSTFSRYAPYLWDVFVAARQGLFPAILVDHFKGEVVYLRNTRECVEAYIIGCPGYARGMEHALGLRVGLSTADDLDTIREISRKRFGGISVIFKDMVIMEASV